MQLNSASLLCRDRIAGLIFLIFSLTYGYQTTLIQLFPGDEYGPFTARTLPFMLTSAGIFLSLLLIAMAQPDEKSGAVMGFNWRLLISFVVLMTAYGFGLTWLGFVLATSLFY
jgi:putative tricarboxylic transport membrane protein